MDVRVGLWRKLSAKELMLLSWCRRLLRVPWTARRANQSILKEISPEYSLEGLMLKLKLQYFGHLMQRTDSLEKTLMLRKIEVRRRRERQRVRWLDGITDSMDVSVNSGSCWWTARTGMLQFMGLEESEKTEQLNWTESQNMYWSSPSLHMQELAIPDPGEIVHIHTYWMDVSKLKMWLPQLTMPHSYNSNPVCEPSRRNLYFKHRNLWVYGKLMHPICPQ